MWLAILLLLASGFGLGALLGAPYLPVLRRDVETLLDLAELGPGQHLIDLGSGDGKLLKAAARRGIRATGYEINPLLYVAARLNCWRYRRLVTIHLADFWRVPWPPADVIYVFLIGRYMRKLDHQLQHRITRPTRVVSYVFEIPDRTAVASTKNSFCYRYPIS
ncbi:MAG TPA: hypothetical protein VK963_04120 [Candidatus Saccharimonadales bacterium]|nr:hypothetical protein [Candidatus Saccharimonadales bacterium]